MEWDELEGDVQFVKVKIRILSCHLVLEKGRQKATATVEQEICTTGRKEDKLRERP